MPSLDADGNHPFCRVSCRTPWGLQKAMVATSKDLEVSEARKWYMERPRTERFPSVDMCAQILQRVASNKTNPLNIQNRLHDNTIWSRYPFCCFLSRNPQPLPPPRFSRFKSESKVLRGVPKSMQRIKRRPHPFVAGSVPCPPITRVWIGRRLPRRDARSFRLRLVCGAQQPEAGGAELCQLHEAFSRAHIRMGGWVVVYFWGAKEALS